MIRKINYILLFLFIISCKKEIINLPQNQTETFSSIFLNKWIDIHLEMIKHTSGYTPPVASRTIGYTYLALYESVVGGMNDYKSYNEILNFNLTYPILVQDSIYDRSICATYTISSMLKYFFPLMNTSYKIKIDSMEKLDSINSLMNFNPIITNRSIEYGRSIASVIYEWSRTDGGNDAFVRNYPSNYTPPSGAGLWVPTPSPVQPAFNYKSAMQPYWGANRPFLLSNTIGNALLSIPPEYSQDTSSNLYKEANAVYKQGINNTIEEISIARFWADDVGSYSPPGHSLAIANIIIKKNNSNLQTASVVLSKIGIAVNDAFINCFKSKYIYNFLRPVTYIQRNIDSSWNTTIGTPPFPEYASCHSTQSAATAIILTQYFGDNISFTDNSKDDVGYLPRTFPNFKAFASEAAISRFYGGVHYRFSCSRGLEIGEIIGNNVLDIQLKK